MNKTLSERDLNHFWHPCTQMKDHESLPLIEIALADKCYLKTYSGEKLFDAISSWWCKILGHGHPQLKTALVKQCEKMEHVMMAGTTNETIVGLSEMLAALLPPLSKVFYASDGSSAVEIALKMSLHSRKILSQTQRKKFAALSNGYHGETIGALSVSDLGEYKLPYQDLLFTTTFIDNIPYVNSIQDPLWQDCSAYWEKIEKKLALVADELTAIIVEPIVQGAGGMRIYSADFLKRLRAWSAAHGIHLIADEIMTGLGRTGKMLACEHAEITPDFLCLSKGLTAGWLPMSAVLTTQTIYDYFYDDYEKGKSFLHSHTFSGNALAAAIACETLDIIQQTHLVKYAVSMGDKMRQYFAEFSEKFYFLKNIRGIGAIIAADISWSSHKRLSTIVAHHALKHGIFLRTLGNTLYWFPPLITEKHDLELLKNATENILKDLEMNHIRFHV